MSTGLPTIRELVAEGAATLPEPFSRAALINWIHARRPDVGVASISTHIQSATENSAPPTSPTPRCCSASAAAPTSGTARTPSTGPRSPSPPGWC
ncbi:hypothetical protein E4P39_12805 [Blastococcus sp. CT_GayMR19]|uniref:DUF7669 domain-containing protein n=1 Tax=Blastococcus sp. CT_GayMR19 TaxID=2559608 RepID=UPI0010747988|nr:hypothetical protein [Blastococcus sp. CT_GayMR19]TFV74371.1 hypothetical protein E4P39_12805 [Blastococcus sp. CT_GayMR19]